MSFSERLSSFVVSAKCSNIYSSIYSEIMQQKCYYYVMRGHIVYFCCRCGLLWPVPCAKSDTRKYELGTSEIRVSEPNGMQHLFFFYFTRLCTKISLVTEHLSITSTTTQIRWFSSDIARSINLLTYLLTTSSDVAMIAYHTCCLEQA